jgi:DNA repair exonuclease SbcCD nuclease subunit
MTEKAVTVLFIGDPHFMISNIPEVEIFIERMTALAQEKNPDLIIVAGDLLHTHERLHTLPLNKAYEFVDKMRKISKTYVLVGNHDMCLGKDVPVLLWDGTTKMSHDIKIGDMLIGDDGYKRKVETVCSGFQYMFEIVQKNADNYIVSKNHILTLKCGIHKSIFWNNTKNCWTVKWVDRNTMKLHSKFFSLRYRNPECYSDYLSSSIEEAKNMAISFLNTLPDMDLIDISVEDYLNVPRNVQDGLYGTRSGCINWDSQFVSLDPYILGMWLGDGNKDGSGFSSSNIELIQKWCEWAYENGGQIVHTGQYNFYVRNSMYKQSATHVLSQFSSCKTCKSCLIHKNKYNKAPFLICASLNELRNIINKDEKTIKYFTDGALKNQKLIVSNVDDVKKILYWKEKYIGINSTIKHKNNPLRMELKKYNLYNNKYIPNSYLFNDESIRLKLLAGFVDTDSSVIDGRTIVITQGGVNLHLIDELDILVKSLGFSSYKSDTIPVKGTTFFRKTLTISGDIEKIPTMLLRKKCVPIINNRVDSSGRVCHDRLKTSIKVIPIGVSEYFGFSVDKNNRFLLGDFTITHNCNNQQFLTENHWLNGMKEWNNTIIIDKVVTDTINDVLFTFVPYVSPGRFEEALNTLPEDGPDWKDSDCIFAHQEFFGCKMGAIVSVEGDKWSLDYPEIVSGHIHSKQKSQKNVYYPGSAMQHAFGESTKNIIAHLTFEGSKTTYKLNEIDLNLPRKRIVYMDVENVDDYELPNTDDKIKITVSGVYDQFKALKKTKKYKKLVKDGIKVVFKAKKIEHEKEVSENIVNETAFTTILSEIVNQQKDSYLYETYELVVNNKQVSSKDVVYLD